MNVHLKRVLILLLVFTFVFQMAGVTSLSHVQAYADTETEEALVVSDADEAAEVTTEEIDTESPGEIETDGENPPDTAEEPAAQEAASEETAEVPVETPADETVTVEEPTESAEAKAPVLKAANNGRTVLAFTSDIHNNSNNVARNRMNGWIESIESNDSYGKIETFAFCGDMSAIEGESQFWTNTQSVMSAVDAKSIDGVYTTGNHEFNPGNYTQGKNDTTKEYIVSAEGKNGDNYRIYCIGTNNWNNSKDNFTQGQVDDLTEYLGQVKNDKPIFVLTHFPLHRYSSGYITRETTNAKLVIDALNNAVDAGKTIILLWGHNHSQRDPAYDQIYAPGYEITYASGKTEPIKFYYAAAGCMSDTEYTGSSSVKGKGMIVTIDDNSKAAGSTIELAYFNESGSKLTTNNSSATINFKAGSGDSGTTYTLTDKLEAGKEYLIATADSGNAYILSNEAGTATGSLKGYSVNIADGKITLDDTVPEANVAFSCVKDTASSDANSTWLEIDGKCLYMASKSDLSMADPVSGKYWHYIANDGTKDKNLLWFFQDSNDTTTNTYGYTWAGSTYRYYLQYSDAGEFTKGTLTSTTASLANTDTPKIYLFVKGDGSGSGDTPVATETRYVLTDDFKANGEYVLITEDNNGAHALKNAGSGSVGCEDSLTIYPADGLSAEYVKAPDASVIWTYDTSNSRTRLQNNSRYLTIENSTDKPLVTETHGSSTATYNASYTNSKIRLEYYGGTSSNYYCVGYSNGTFSSIKNDLDSGANFKLYIKTEVEVEPTAVEGISVDDVTVEEGKTVDLNITFTPENASDTRVTYEVGDETIATVNNGKVAGLKEGTTTITVTTVDGNFSDTCNVLVTASTATKYVLTDKLEKGDYLIVSTSSVGTAYALKNPGATSSGATMGSTNVTIESGNIILTSDTDIVWEATPNTLSSVEGFDLTNNGGYIEGKSGKVNIFDSQQYNTRCWTYDGTHLEHKGGSYYYEIYYDNGFTYNQYSSSGSPSHKVYLFKKEAPIISATDITVSPTEKTILAGENAQLTATVTPENATGTVTWTSNAETIATVDSSGKVTGVSVGTATITAAIDGLTATCTVTVNPVPVESVTLNKTTAEVMESKTLQLTATVLPETATDKTVTWSSSNPAIASVDNTGKVTGNAVGGPVTITATAGGKSATCAVTVTEYVAPTGYIIMINGYALSHDSENEDQYTSSSNNYYGLKAVTYDISSDPTDNILWVITPADGEENGYYIQDQEGNYLNATYTSSNNVKTGHLNLDATSDVWYLDTGVDLDNWILNDSYLRSKNATAGNSGTGIYLAEETGSTLGHHLFTVRSSNGYDQTSLIDPTVPIETRYVETESLELDKKYIVAAENTETSVYAIKNNNGTIIPQELVVTPASTTENAYITTEDTGVVWNYTKPGSTNYLINNSQRLYYDRNNSYVLTAGSSGYAIAYNANNHLSINSNRYVAYNNQFTAQSGESSAAKIRLFVESKVIVPSGHTHTYGNPEWTWAEDHTSATATFTCTECDDTQTVTDNAPAETVVTAADCETDKVVKYTATVTFEEKTYTDTTDNVTVEGTATGHDYGDATYEWAADNSSVTGTRVCSNDATHTITETVNTTSEITKAATCEGKGETTYTAAFTKEGFTTQTKTVENINALGHDYGNATYEWADNNASVTGTRVCSHDATHTITETVNTTSEITKPATCEGKGETTYTATFTKEGFATQTKTVENINALGHDYGAPVWDWDGVTAATATFTCGNDPTHQVTENAIITNAQGTGEKEGYTVYTATVTFNEETYSDTKDVINQYTLTFLANEGDTEPYATVTKAYGAAITEADLPAAPTKAFYTFNSWTPAVPETMPAENKTFTATWTEKEAYYLIGSMTEWKVVEANEFVANPDNPAEYSVAATLTAGDQIKVVKAVAGEAVNTEYYPSAEHEGYNGQTSNYTVDQYHAGNVTVYFRPAGNFADAGWQGFGGFFYIEGDHAITVVTSPENAGTATVMREDSSEAATSAPKGKTLTVNAAPADNYQLDKIEIWKTNGGTAAEQTLEGNTFNMPDYDVTVKVYFKVITWTFVDFTWEQTADGYNAIANYRGDNGSTKTVAATVTSRITTAATCEGEGQIVYTATVTAADSLDGTAQSEDKPVTIPAAGHEYGDLIPEVAPDCTTEGTKAHYECSVCHKLFDTNKVETTVEALKITATGHDWEFVDFSWTGYTAAIANYKCKNDATHTQTVNATVTSVTTPATCETAGNTVYTATVAAADSLDKTLHTDSKTVAIPAIEHDWEFTDFTWIGSDEAGYTAAAANYKCKNDAIHTQTVNATVTSVTTAATCEVAGKTVYTATVAAADSLDGKAQTADKTVTIPATGHNWGAPEWTWIGNDTDGYTGVKATFTCTNNSQHTQTVESDNVSVTGRVEPTPETNGSITYSASITGPDNRVYSIQKEIIIPATGYSFEDPEYNWAETADGYTCSALMACKEDHTKDITETVSAAYRVAAAPTCEGKGTGIYTATFTNSKFVTQYKEVEIAATGHDWNDPTYEWNADHTSVIATFVCKNDAKHTDTATASGSAITSEITTQPTATTPGVRTYTASITFGGKTYTATATETIPATGASVSGNITSFVSNSAEGAVSVELFRDGSETAAYTATVSSDNKSYAFAGVDDGTYTMKVSKKDHATRTYEITVAGAAVTQDVKIHLLGDINGDGDVTTVDAARVNSHAKGKTLLTGYEFSCGDINGDGDITTVDAARTNAHAKGASLIWE